MYMKKTNFNEFDFLVRFAYILNRWRFPEGNHYTYIV